jgi:hypothetical protein
MNHVTGRSIGTTLAGVLLGVNIALAQEPPPQTAPPTTPPTQAGDPARGRGQNQRPGRQNLPAAGPMSQQQLQEYFDVHAIVVSERELLLTDDQRPGFIARLTKLQQTRRQQIQQRNRAMRELMPLVQGAGPFRDDVIAEKLKALDELNQKTAQEVRQAELELDGVLKPWQRVRFRMLEERLERQKIDLLIKLRQSGGGGVGPAPQAPKGSGGS